MVVNFPFPYTPDYFLTIWLSVNFPQTFLVSFPLVLEQGKDKDGHVHVVKTYGRVEG
jgi:hypothetical protein